MFRPYCIQFSLIEAEFIQDYQNLAQNVTNLQLLNIYDTPSAQKGLELLSQDWFKTKVLNQQSLVGINFKIDEKIDEKFYEKPHFHEFINKESFLVGFQSTLGGHESRTYWKLPKREQFYSVYVDDDECDDVTSLVQEFLTEEIRNNRTGISPLYTNRNIIHVQKLADSQGNNLLMIAVINNRLNVVQRLLKVGFSVDESDSNNELPIDLAWNYFMKFEDEEKNIAGQIINLLLEANSTFPMDFEYENAPKNVQEFVDFCKNVHQDLQQSKFDQIKSKLGLHLNLVHIYNLNNCSLLAQAVKSKKYEIFDLLDRGICTGYHEYLDDVYRDMLLKHRRMLRKQHQLNAITPADMHIFVLIMKTRIGNNDQFSHKRWKSVSKAYEALNNNKCCSKILKVAVKCKNLKIFMDFKHDVVYYMDPTRGKNTLGTAYEDGTLYIGAKYLADDEKMFEVLSVMAHEFCHLAVFIAFMNPNWNPFPIGESDLKRRFIADVMKQCRENQDREEIVKNAFGYDDVLQESEMIVTVPQMLMYYHGNDAKIAELKQIFKELFKYSKEFVEPELERALDVLEKLNSEIMALKFNNLTTPMKAAILHAEINFNGSKTSFFELIGDDQEIMQLLPPEDIKKFILESKPIQIGSYVEPEFKYGVIERRFEELIEKNKNLPAIKKKSEKQKQKTFQTIQEETKNSKIFILADHAGTGKTTTFKYSADKLKKSTSSAFVSFINLRKQGKIFEKYQDDPNSLNLQQVCELLLQILNLQTKIEIEIFKKLFSTGKVIFFFDGVDEICPKYTKLVMKIFQILNESVTANQLWISTRLHHVKTLQLLHPTVHKFVPYTKEEKENFVKTILQVNRIEENQNETATKIVEYVKKLEGYYYESKEIDNPLMIQIITELYIQNKAELDTSNRIEIYKAMIEKQKEEVGDKVPISERDKDSAFSIWDAHRVLAFKLIFGVDYEKELKFKLDQLPIMQKWQIEMKNFTSDMIQRYGFVIVDLDDLEDERSSIDFMHRTYAEYFVAKYLIDFIYDESGRSNDEEDKMKFKLFAVVIERPKKFKVVRDFIVSFVKSQGPEMIVKSAFKSLILEHIKKTLNLKRPRFFDRFKATVENYVDVSSLEPATMTKLWKIDDQQNILKYQSLKSYRDNSEVIKLAFLSFGANWRERFNKSASNLITDEEMEELREPNIDDSQWTEDKNFLKFYDYVDKNFSIDDKKTLYGRAQTDNFGYSSQIQIQIISRMRNVLKNKEFADKFLLNDYYKHRHVSAVPVKFILECIEEDNNSDLETMKAFLCNGRFGYESPMDQGFDSGNSEILHLIRDFYIKYIDSWTKVQDHLIGIKGNHFLYPVASNFYPDYKNLIIEIFGDNISRVGDKISSTLSHLRRFHVKNSAFENMKDFFNLVFSNDPKKGLEVFEYIEFGRNL